MGLGMGMGYELFDFHVEKSQRSPCGRRSCNDCSQRLDDIVS